MKKQAIIEKAIKKMSRLPEQKILEVSDYVDFLISKMDNQELASGVRQLNENSRSFHFLEEEEELYDDSDIIKE